MISNWNRSFPDCEPIAHQLKNLFPDRWVRFHSLPESKRYAENENEYATILARHNCILGELAQDAETLALLTTDYSELAEPTRSQGLLKDLDPHATHWHSIAMHELEKDHNFINPSYWHVWVSHHAWKPNLFDGLLRLVADVQLSNLMIVALDCRWLVHPYDGGLDVILESSTTRDKLKARHSNWLSLREDGL